MATASSDEHDTIWADFKDAVNMSAAALEKHLATDASRSVGQKSSEGGESTGHAEGRRIIAMLGTKKGEITDDDYAHMKKVVGYVKRHLEQGGPKDKDAVADSPWRLSLMNWGHDPLKS